MLVLFAVLAVVALIGHMAFWVGLSNRWHSTGFPRPLIKWTTLILYFVMAGPPLAAVRTVYEAWPVPSDWGMWDLFGDWTYYLVFSLVFGLVHLPLWALQRWTYRRNPDSVRLLDHRVVNIVEQLGASPARGPRTQLLSRLPLNEIWQLNVNEFAVELPRMPRALAGLSICHWSDFHLSGRFDRSYFDEVVRLTNEMQVDIIALTGDICDKPRCIDWIADMLGPAEARLGKFFVFGNHDLRTRDLMRLRDAMSESNFVDVGNRQITIHDGQIEVAGNQIPWIKPAPGTELLPQEAGHALRILLSHSPDQFAWAQARGFDLMLAGHTHGGQIQFPWVGPVVCPSVYGVKYASGFFRESPTLMHVSRGTAGLMPLRLNCPPEMTRLVLEPPAGQA